ncbi:hypothetical protein Mspyr1_55730 (plasmid) [Mycolicibacterium gilvum Spyr1]|uniref:Uncharacterized protein n=1 Tax=Mycolicibacterium gilvum (strain DSM 45189 / LMG 24558 / Spyr1) TaxID=278137 RepID=E6TQ82_MYCSR|nr:hypothetical protein Mspyr1_55730 [Mycolicibacterium gilvum Spyr1]
MAAEATIAAATAALVWEGPDSYGVLERVAGATAKGMATARITAEIMADVTTSVQFTAADEDARGGAVAGLPGWLAPRWAASVRGALDELEAAGRPGDIMMKARTRPALRSVAVWTQDGPLQTWQTALIVDEARTALAHRVGVWA